MMRYNHLKSMEKDAFRSQYLHFSRLPPKNTEAIIRIGLTLLDNFSDEDCSAEKARIRFRIGTARIARAELEEASRSLTEARRIHEVRGDEADFLRDQLALGTVCSLSDQPEAAFNIFLSVREIARNDGFRDVEEAACSKMGRICREQGRYGESRVFLDAAAKLVNEIDHTGREAVILYEYGMSALAEGSIESAADYLEKAARIAEGYPGVFDYEYKIGLGELYIVSNRLPEALEMLTDCLGECEKNGILQGEIEARFHLGNLYHAMGDGERAGDYWRECRGLTADAPLGRIRVLSGERLAADYRSRGDFEKAFTLIDEIREEEHRAREERLRYAVGMQNQRTRIDDLEREMAAWRQRSGELERIRGDREEAIRELETIKTIGQEITSTLNPDVIVSILYDRLAEILTVDGMFIGFLGTGIGEIDPCFIIENGERRDSPTVIGDTEGNLFSWVIRNNSDLIINSRDDFPEGAENIEYVHGTRIDGQSILVVVLRMEGVISGMIVVQALEKDQYKMKNLKLLQALSGFVTAAFANSNAHQNLVEANEKIAHMAAHDALTGLANRMQIMDRLDQELKRCRRYDLWLAVLFIDMDGFKNVNDTYGHNAGDEVLVEVSRRFTESIRATDAVGRLAGDEFLILLTDDCRPEEGMKIARQIVECVSACSVLSHVELSITASIGLAFYPDNGGTPEVLVNAADQAMYSAKFRGKNQIFLSNCPAYEGGGGGVIYIKLGWMTVSRAA